MTISPQICKFIWQSLNCLIKYRPFESDIIYYNQVGDWAHILSSFYKQFYRFIVTTTLIEKARTDITK